MGWTVQECRSRWPSGLRRRPFVTPLLGLRKTYKDRTRECLLGGGGMPVGTRFFTSVQTGPRAHLASCTVCSGPFSRLKRTMRGVNLPSLAPRLKKMQICAFTPPYTLLAFVASSGVKNTVLLLLLSFLCQCVYDFFVFDVIWFAQRVAFLEFIVNQMAGFPLRNSVFPSSLISSSLINVVLL